MHQVLRTLHCALRLGRVLRAAREALLLMPQDMHTDCSCCHLDVWLTPVQGCHRQTMDALEMLRTGMPLPTQTDVTTACSGQAHTHADMQDSKHQEHGYGQCYSDTLRAAGTNCLNRLVSDGFFV